jgi:opacity protein-like surface antigen
VTSILSRRFDAGLALTAIVASLTLAAGAAKAADLPYRGKLPPAPVISSEAPAGGLYGALRGSLNWLDDTRFDVLGLPVHNRYEMGYGVMGAVGYSFPNAFGAAGVRAELELGYMNNDIKSHNVGGTTFAGADAFGRTGAITGLGNFYLDFGLGAFKPYLTAGAGFAAIDFKGHGVTPVGVVASNSDTVFAWQAGAGVAVEIASMLSIELGYRYFQSGDFTVQAIDGTRTNTKLEQHTGLVGVRYGF